MSRSDYCDDLDNWALIRWRGAVNSAIRGKRGQAMLKELLQALDALPDKRLIDYDLVDPCGEHCALGALGAKRGVDLESIDPLDPEEVSHIFNIAEALVREIVFINDEAYYTVETPEHRFQRVRAWVVEQIQEGPA